VRRQAAVGQLAKFQVLLECGRKRRTIRTTPSRFSRDTSTVLRRPVERERVDAAKSARWRSQPREWGVAFAVTNSLLQKGATPENFTLPAKTKNRLKSGAGAPSPRVSEQIGARAPSPMKYSDYEVRLRQGHVSHRFEGPSFCPLISELE
jgi:hypothetical protein